MSLLVPTQPFFTPGAVALQQLPVSAAQKYYLSSPPVLGKRTRNQSVSPPPQSGGKRSPGSEAEQSGGADERLQRRRLSNRESARRSRQRKQQRLNELAAEAACLRGKNEQIIAEANDLVLRITSVESENTVLRVQAAELAKRLRSVTAMLHTVGMPPGGTNPWCMMGTPEPMPQQWPGQPMCPIASGATSDLLLS